jgi:hypothetical protein
MDDILVEALKPRDPKPFCLHVRCKAFTELDILGIKWGSKCALTF